MCISEVAPSESHVLSPAAGVGTLRTETSDPGTPGTTVGRSVGSTWLIPVLGKAIDCSFNVDHKRSVQSPIYRPSAQPGLSRAGAGGIGGGKRGMGSCPDPFAMWTAEGPLAPAAFLTHQTRYNRSNL